MLVPGPGDLGPGSSLPRPGLPRALAADLLAAVPNAVLASNPCRIRHGASQLVVFRDNLQQRMRGLAILPPAPAPAAAGAAAGAAVAAAAAAGGGVAGEGGGGGTPPSTQATPLFEHVCATVLQQAHLCPVPLEYQVGGRGGGKEGGICRVGG